MTGGQTRLRMAAATACLLVTVCAITEPLATRITVGTQDRSTAGALYVGAARCTACHADVAQSCDVSPHALALRRMTDAPIRALLAGQTVTRGDITYHYEGSDGALHVASPSYAEGRPIELQWCFGAGEHAHTFLSLLRTSSGLASGLEHRLSWWVEPGMLDVTIGHDKQDPPGGLEAIGKLYPLSELRSCFGCHATVLPDRMQDVGTGGLVAGVQCERCHGPGRDHIAAARRGNAAGSIERLSELDPVESVQRCGDCHRRAEQMPPEQVYAGSRLIARFQPVGLTRSMCFRRSLERRQGMSCVTCHNPHEPRERDRTYYSARCVQCHDPAGLDSVCSVAPRSDDCVSCHMPTMQVGTHMTVTDHWIRRPGFDQRPTSDERVPLPGLFHP